MNTSTPLIPSVTLVANCEEDTSILPDSLTFETQEIMDVAAAERVPYIKVKALDDLQGQPVDNNFIKRKDEKGNVIRLIGLDGLITIQVSEDTKCLTKRGQEWTGLNNNDFQYDTNVSLNTARTVFKDTHCDQGSRQKGKVDLLHLVDLGQSTYEESSDEGGPSEPIEKNQFSTGEEIDVEKVNQITETIFYDESVDPFGETMVDTISENQFDFSITVDNSTLVEFNSDTLEAGINYKTVNKNGFDSKLLEIPHCSDSFSAVENFNLVESDGLESNNSIETLYDISTVGSENSQEVHCSDPFNVDHVTFVECDESVDSTNLAAVHCSDPLGGVEHSLFNGCDNNGLESDNNLETIHKNSTEGSENSQILYPSDSVEYNTLCGSDTSAKDEHEPDRTLEKMEVVETVQNFDETGLKEGIIEASRTLINTQKSLKLLTQIFCAGDQQILKRRRAVKLVAKFQSTLKSFKKSIDRIEKSAKNQYSHLFTKTDIDSLLESIMRVEKATVQINKKKKKPSGCAYEIVSFDKPSDSAVNFDNSSSEMCNKRLDTGCVNLSEGDKDHETNELEYVEVKKHQKPRFRVVQPKCRSEVQEHKKRKYTHRKNNELDKTFSCAGSKVFENTLLKRDLPVRSCRKEQLWDSEEEVADES